MKTVVDNSDVPFVGNPTTCDICFDGFPPAVGTIMYDAKTVNGPWGCLCEKCFGIHTTGKLGVGYGQKYQRRHDGRFWKVAG